MAQPASAGSSINADLSSKIRAVSALAAIVGNDTTEGTGAAVDLKGYESATLIMLVGDSGDTLSGSVYITPSIQESDTGSGSWTAVPTSALRVDVGDFDVIDAPAEDTKLVQVAVLAGASRKRYLRLLLTFTGTHTNGTPVAAAFIKGHPRVAPATA